MVSLAQLQQIAGELAMAKGFLTTHVLDTARGCPAEGIRIELFRVSGNSHRKIGESVTNADGRTDTPILPEADFKPGTYELIFHAGDYIRKHKLATEDPLFLDQVPIRFGMAQDDHYHVPLLISPYGMGTYRGS